MVADVDCVSRTRHVTWMFHGVDVSVREVYRCLVSLQRLVTRLVLSEANTTDREPCLAEMIQAEVQVRSPRYPR